MCVYLCLVEVSNKEADTFFFVFAASPSSSSPGTQLWATTAPSTTIPFSSASQRRAHVQRTIRFVAITETSDREYRNLLTLSRCSDCVQQRVHAREPQCPSSPA